MPTNAINDTGVKYVYDKLNAKKVDKETGKGLSTNDYTTAEKTKLSGISTGANKTASSTTNGNIKINDVETQVYDDSEIQDKIDETTTSISGNPISISGLKANQLAVNPIITLEPIQAGSGDPSPSNIRAISGYDKVEVLSSGKNILDLSKLGSYQVTASGTMRYGVPVYLKAGTYTFSKSGGSATLYLTNVTDNYSYVEIGSAQYPYTFSVNANSYVIFRTSGNTPSNWDIVNAQLEEGSSATTYEPYVKATSISESLGQTVYGGSDDVREGDFTNEWKEIDLSAQTWSTWQGLYYVSVADAKGELSTTGGLMAEQYETTMNNPNDNTIFINYQKQLFVRCATGETPQGKAIYKIANPTHIKHTPREISLLKDYAYVSTNGTSIALDYHNGELASLADVSQLGETVNELGNYVGRNNAYSYVNLTSTSYEFPNDGYIVVDSQAVTSGAVRVQLTGYNGSFAIGGIYMNITGAYQIQTTFVKKGMRARVIQDVTGVRKRFVPLV